MISKRVTRFVSTVFLGFEVSISGDKDLFLLLRTGPGTFHVGDFFLAFRATGDGLSVLVPAVSQVAPVQTNQDAIVVHFGQAALGPYRGKSN